MDNISNTNDAIALSDAEWKLMNILWDKQEQECTITKLVSFLKEDTGWSKHTVITMLSRLQTKGAVSFREGENKRAKSFFPLIERENTRVEETKSFLSKLYGGSLGLMVNTMVNEKSLSEEEINELYEILNKTQKQTSDGGKAKI